MSIFFKDLIHHVTALVPIADTLLISKSKPQMLKLVQQLQKIADKKTGNSSWKKLGQACQGNLS